MTKGEKRIGFLIAVVLIVLAVTSFVKAACTEYTAMEVVVQEGDTLWGIWEEVGYGRFDAWMVETKKLNDKDLSVLRPYSKITVPVIK